MLSLCGTFWGSHACDLEPGHPGVCECNYGMSSPCSQYDPLSNRARYSRAFPDLGTWTEWMEVGA